MPTIENGRDGMVSVLCPLDELAQLQDAGSIFCVTECENVATRYGRDESIGHQVRKLFVPKMIEQYEAGFEVSVKEHCKYVLVWMNVGASLTTYRGETGLPIGRPVRHGQPGPCWLLCRWHFSSSKSLAAAMRLRDLARLSSRTCDYVSQGASAGSIA